MQQRAVDLIGDKPAAKSYRALLVQYRKELGKH